MEDKLCFNNLFNLIYGYVKITDEEPKQEPKEPKQEPKEPKEPKKKSKQEPKEPKEPKQEPKQELKYKSTGVKVDIINNGKVIKRIIYLGNDDNKYVKLNKEYELLSNLIKEEQKEIKKKSKKEIKYKSTGVKVDIINNKKVIKRIIYLGNDNNKYVKLNKEYELLSNLIKKDI
jgi:hypothetical protein